MASELTGVPIILAAIFFIGFAFGAEGDAIAFLVARHFKIDFYSSVMGLMTAIIALTGALGALLLSYTLAQTNSYSVFLYIAGGAVLVGALSLLRLDRCSVEHEE